MISTGGPRSLVIGLTYDREYEHDPGLGEIERAVRCLGHEAERVGDLYSLVDSLATRPRAPWDVVFNLAGGSRGTSRELQIPSLLDAYGIVHTFASAPVMAICGDKAKTKMVLQHHDIPTAPFCVVSSRSVFDDRSREEWHAAFKTSPCDDGATAVDCLLDGNDGTLFVKPAAERSSAGISSSNETATAPELNAIVHSLRQQFPTQDMLVEKYLSGREFTVAITGTGHNSSVLAVLEILIHAPVSPNEGPERQRGKHGRVYTADMKNGSDPSYACVLAQQDADPEVAAAAQVALRAWTALGGRDAGRVDVRSDVRGREARPHVIEVSPMPGIKPNTSKLAIAADLVGVGYIGLIEKTIAGAVQRLPCTN